MTDLIGPNFSFELESFLSKPSPDYGFVIDDRHVTFDWGHKGYWIDLDRLTKPEHLLALIAQIGKKNWKGMTPARISALVQAFQSLRKWQRTF